MSSKLSETNEALVERVRLALEQGQRAMHELLWTERDVTVQDALATLAERLDERQEWWAQKHLDEQRAAMRMVDRAQTAADDLSEALERIEGMAGAGGSGQVPAMPIARAARDALTAYREARK